MAGEHRYSSSLFIQSGSIAQFKNGITASSLNIEGTVTATQYLLSNGTVAGTADVFFAGNPVGISASAPFSQDNFISLNNSNQDPTDSTKVATETIFIQATGSSTFKPNFFNFVKLGDDETTSAIDGSTLLSTTVQQGGLNSSSYNPSSSVERKIGVHRYLVFAAETGSGGQTHQVFHTVTIDAFANIPPEIVSPLITHVSLSMEHNLDSGSLILHFTNSFDQNQIDDGEGVDFLNSFGVARITDDPTIGPQFNDPTDKFKLILNHDDIEEIIGNDAAFEITANNIPPGLSSSAGAPKLHFTASVVDYNSVTSTLFNTIAFSKTQNQDFKITLQDTQADLPEGSNPGVTTKIISMAIVPPPTASIENIKVRFEGSDNEGGFSNISSDIHSHVLLYDRGSTLTSKSISELDDRYTSSLVRIRVTSDITPPIGYEKTESNYDTRVQIHQNTVSNNIGSSTPNFNVFKFKSTEQTASFTGSSVTDFNSIGENENITTESNGYTSFEITPTFNGDETEDTLFYGTVNDDVIFLNTTSEVQHGRHDHFNVLNKISAIQLDIQKCPNILIKNSKVEIQKGSKYWEQDEGRSSIVTNLLYGLKTTLQSYQTESQILDPLGVNAINHPQIDLAQGFEGGNYITESIIRLRVLADIVEPFGPDHTPITAKLSNDTNTIQHSFNFTINDNTDVISSDFGYTTNHGYGTFGAENNLDYVNKELLTSSYTSSWVEFNFNPGSYTFNVGFTRTDADSTKTQITELSPSTPATLDLFSTSNTDITNINHQIETFGYSNVLTNTSSRDVLYGDNHYTNETSESKSWKNHPLAETYASHSVTRFKVSGKLVEPFGPGRCRIAITPSIVSILSTDVENLLNVTWDTFTLVSDNNTNVVDTNPEIFYDNDQLVTEFTTSFIGIKLNLNSDEYGNSETYKIGSSSYVYDGPFDIEPSNFSETNTLDSNFPTQSTNLTVRDTFKTKITNIFYEIETFGYANVGDDSLETVTTESKRTVLYGFPHHTTIDSSSFENHPSSSIYASHSVARFRVRAKVTEPIGYLHTASRFEEVWTNNIDSENFSSTLHFETGSSKSPNPNPTLIENSSSGYDLRNRLTSSYTSSWIGKQLSSSINNPKTWTYSSGSILHEPNGENKFTTSSFHSTSLVINDTEPTKISHIIYETETFGYSNEPITNEKRTVLYGDPHITNEKSSSTTWANHSRAIQYASQSVSRFRIRTKITEPLGPLHHTSSLVKQWSSSYQNVNSGSYLFHTASENLIISKSYDSKTRLAVEYTGSFDGIVLETSPGTTTTYTHTGSFTHEPEGENSASFEANTNTILQLHDTPKTKINITRIETETFGESNVGLTNPLASDSSQDFRAISRSLIAGISSTQLTGDEEDIFTRVLVSKFRTLVDITEPVGPLHHHTKLGFPFIPRDQTHNPSVPSHQILNFTTNSAIFNGNIEFGFNPKNQITASYTSSFLGTKLTATDISDTPSVAHWIGTYDSELANKSHNPSGENGGDFSFNSNHPIKLQVSSSTSQINRPKITNLRLEVETISGSGIGSFERTVTIPHGNSATLVSQSVNNEYVEGSSGSLVSVRILADIEEIPGHSHFGTKIEIGGYSTDISKSNSRIMTFTTNSSEIETVNFTLTSIDVGMIAKYTSSFFTVGLSASGNIVIDSDSPTSNAETKDFLISASVISYNNISVDGIGFDVITPSEPSHSIIHVTGALSSSIEASLHTSSLNLSSSIFADGEEESLYYLYDLDMESAELISFFPSIKVTPPISKSGEDFLPITSESNLRFPNNLDITYNLDSTPIDSHPLLLNDNPTNGTGSIIIYEQVVDGFTKPERLTLSSIITDFSEGHGKTELIQHIFIIPAQPPTMSGDLGDLDFEFNNNKLYVGALPSHSFDNYKEGERPDNPNTFVNVNNILITSKSDGTGNDYSMSFHTPTNSTGDYGGSNAFSHGDSGSLIVKINGLQVVNYNIQDGFNPSLKSGPQNMNSYPNGGTASFGPGDDSLFYKNKGKLILHSVTPFNNVSQSLFVGNEFFPNGFQVFSASIFLDEKMRDGYNFLEFSHSIDGTRTASMGKFEWYYDDGLSKPKFHSTSDMSITDEEFALHSLEWNPYLNTPATFSLSGVSYFMEDKNFLLSLKNNPILPGTSKQFFGITDIAHKTYRDQDFAVVAITQQVSDGYTITTGSTTQNSQGNVFHSLNSTSNKNGFAFNKLDFDDLVPSSSSTASIENLIINCTNANFSINDTFQNSFPSQAQFNGGDFHLYKGVLKEIKFKLSRRNLSSNDGWNSSGQTITLPIGRFIDTSSINTGHTGQFNTGSIHDENFHTEDFRWKSSSWANDSFLEVDRNGDYSYFLDQSNCDFDSTAPRTLDTIGEEMFQSVLGALLPAKLSSVVNPTFTDYKNNQSIGGDTLDLTTPSDYKVFFPNISSFEPNTPNVDPTNFQSACYCRALQLPGSLTGTISSFKIKIVGNFGANGQSQKNVFDNGTPINGVESNFNIDSIPGNNTGKGLKVEIRLPGPINPSGNQSLNEPGTKWGVLSGGNNFANATLASGQTLNDWKACVQADFVNGTGDSSLEIPFTQRTNFSTLSNPDPDHYNTVTYNVELGQTNLGNSGGVVLIRLTHLHQNFNYLQMNPYFRSIEILRDE